MAEKRRATTRKRSACGELRTLAAQLGVEDERIGLDMRGPNVCLQADGNQGGL